MTDDRSLLEPQADEADIDPESVAAHPGAAHLTPAQARAVKAAFAAVKASVRPPVAESSEPAGDTPSDQVGPCQVAGSEGSPSEPERAREARRVEGELLPPVQPELPELPELPPQVLALVSQSFDLDEEVWPQLKAFLPGAIDDFAPVSDADYLDAVNYAFLLRERMDLMGHQGRLQALQRALAVREILAPGTAKLILQGAHLRPRNEMQLVPQALYPLSENDHVDLMAMQTDEVEAQLEKRALATLKTRGLGAKALQTTAFRLALPELQDVAKLLALTEARIDNMREANLRRRALRGPRS